MKAIALHHERVDGKGYPYVLSGNDISIESQIIAVADAYDTMTSSRSYRRAMDRTDALAEFISNRTTQFNSQVVDAFFSVAKEYRYASDLSHPNIVIQKGMQHSFYYTLKRKPVCDMIY